MANINSHKMLSYKGPKFYFITNQLMIAEIDNYKGSFLFSAIYINRKRNNILYNNFT